MKKNTICSYHKNREMNKGTYALRKMVMGFVYEAKELVSTLPRIEIRITDCDRHNVLGTARMNDCVVWIPASTLKMSQDDIRQIVFHEILHAAYGVEHVNSCPLMGSTFKKLDKATTNKLFLKYVR